MSTQKATTPIIKSSDARTPPHLHGYWLAMARVMWLIVTCLILGLFFAGIPGRFDQLVSTADKRSLFELGLSANFYAVGLIVLNLIFGPVKK